MFEIILYFLFLIDSVQQIAIYYLKRICPVGPNTPYWL